MNKAKYVEKMTDLVENTLLDMGVSPYFTIEDGWEEDEELSMTLYHDANEHEVTFNLSSLYQQKKEEDIKVKDQYSANIKNRVVSFVEAEQALNLDNGRNYEEDYDEEEYEDEYDEDEDYDDDEEDYDDDDEYDDEEEYDNEEYDEDFDDEEEDIVNQPKVSRSIQDYFAPLKFSPVNDNPSVMVATLPENYEGDTSKIARRYGKQISEMFDGSFVIRPNKKDVLVLSSEEFGKEEVEEILEELYEDGGDKNIEEFPDEIKER